MLNPLPGTWYYWGGGIAPKKVFITQDQYSKSVLTRSSFVRIRFHCTCRVPRSNFSMPQGDYRSWPPSDTNIHLICHFPSPRIDKACIDAVAPSCIHFRCYKSFAPPLPLPGNKPTSRLPNSASTGNAHGINSGRFRNKNTSQLSFGLALAAYTPW